MKCRPFISYAKEDRAIAERLFRDLQQLGAEPWLDVHRLRGGQTWQHAIRKALRESTHVLTLISESSVTKTGYVQNEVRQALELLDNVPPDQIFVVPVRLDNSTPQHERLNQLHWIDLFPDYTEGLSQIATSLELANAATGKRPPHSLWSRATIVALLALSVGLSTSFYYFSRRHIEPGVINDQRRLLPDGSRGTSEAIRVRIPVNADVALDLEVPEQPPFPQYQLDLTDLSVVPPFVIWRRSDLQLNTAGALLVTIPHLYLRPGVYQIRIIGKDINRSVEIARYTIRATQ